MAIHHINRYTYELTEPVSWKATCNQVREYVPQYETANTAWPLAKNKNALTKVRARNFAGFRKMRGNNFLPIDLGKRQKQILNPNKNNRRVIHYSYNLVNNIGTEEDLVKKDINVQQNSTNSLVQPYATSAVSQYDVRGRQALVKRQGIPERKLSLPSTKNATRQQNGLQGNDSKKLIESSASSLSRDRKTSLKYSSQIAANRKSSEQRDPDRYGGYKSERISRYSDPLYEQRSLPPIPYRSQYLSEASPKNGVWSPNILEDKPKLSQFSKSQGSLVTTGAVARKEGLSAAENKDIMHGKLRKKAVCDSTDDAHYQRQFLRVLNKRF